MMMTNCEKPWIAACGAFAAGEALASLLPSGAEAWPLPLAVAVVVALFGYGFRIRGWRLAAVLMLGVCAFWLSSVSVERQLRETPWMRGARRHLSAPRRADPIRRELSRRIGIGLPADSTAAALNRAMLLGERSRISPKVKRLFVDSGTVHVFAVSGLHVMVVARLLADDLPTEIDSIFSREGFHLLPGGKIGERRYDMTVSCSCPDYANPCKHTCAALLILGEEVARRPATLLELRGIGMEELCDED